MISQAAADEGMVAVYLLLAAASAGVFLHAGIKFPWFVFFQKDSGLRPKDAPWNMGVAMVLFAALCILMGVFPETFYHFLPYETDYVPYTAGKVLFYVQLLLFSGLAFFLLLPLMKRTLTISLDTDWLWRVAMHSVLTAAEARLAVVGEALRSWRLARFATIRARAELYFDAQGEGKRAGVFARNWSIRTTALWIAVLLTGYVLVYIR
jgi:multicomponent Na+:H+ antiporter subunit D